MKHRLTSIAGSLIQAEDLIANREANRLFVDVRLGEPEDEFRKYREGHVFGAVHAQIRDVFASTPTATSGNLPLPTLKELEQRLRKWHVDNETEIVLYGPSPALAARGWWVLRWAGLTNVKVLDGGLKAWVDAGGPVAQGESIPKARADSVGLKLQKDSMPSIDVTEVEKLPDDTILIDARDEASYYAGRIPRARSLPASELWTPTSRLRTLDEIRELHKRAGVQSNLSVVVYCGGGVLSALEVLTLEALGTRARLFVGSWSEWNKSPERMAMSDVAGEQA